MHTRQQKHLAFPNVNVPELAVIHYLKKHSALILVEPLCSLIDVVISPSIWATHNLNNRSL
jgi:hypothetical protein